MEPLDYSQVMGNRTVVFDTSGLSLMGAIPRGVKGDVAREYRRREFAENTAFLRVLAETMKQRDGVYITGGVVYEIEDCNKKNKFNYKKIVRRKGKNINKDCVDHLRVTRGLVRARSQFIETAVQYNGIVQLDETERELYDAHKRNLRDLVEERKLSEVDFDILLTSLAMSYTRIPVALVTNDTGMLRAGAKAVERLGLDLGNIGFFTRQVFPNFQKFYI